MLSGRRDDRVLREEAGERRDADERERAREEAPLRERHHPPEPAHLPDVLLARERVDREARRHEEQRLEEGVRHEVEHPVRVAADPDADEHVADLRHRRVRDHALDVGLDERDQARDEQRERAGAGGEQLDRPRLLEDRVRARDQVDAGGDHRRRVDEGADRRRALHRVGQPRLERDLRRLRHRAAEQAERDRGSPGVEERWTSRRRERERVRVRDEDEERERHRRVAERVHDERLLRGPHRARPLVPEADQEIRREADEPPADEQHEQVAALDEQEHREDEERDVREVAALLVVAVHVADRVEDDQPADAADDQHHHRAQRVDEQLQRPTLKLPDWSHVHAVVISPRGLLQVEGAYARLRLRRVHAEERPDRAAESDEDARRRDPGGGDAREPRSRRAG